MNKIVLALSSVLFLSPVFAEPASVSSPNATEQASASSQDLTPIQQLAYTAQDLKAPKQERADALRQLARYPNQNSLIAVARALKDQDPAIREAAIIGATPYKIEHRWQMVSPLLKDEILQVRTAAATNLVRDFSYLDNAQRQTLEPATAELITVLKARSDSASQLILADTYRWHQDWDKADALYQTLLKKDPKNAQIWLNLADNKRGQKQDQASVEILDQALQLLPNDADLHFSKSLALVRLNQKQQAAKEIKLAATIAKTNSYYWYLDGVLQEEFDAEDSTRSFEQAYLISGAPEQLYAVCGVYARHNNPKTEQCLNDLSQFAPPEVIEELRQLQHK